MKEQHNNVEELTYTMTELVAADYASKAMYMEKLKIMKNTIVEFVNEYYRENKKATFWATKITVNQVFIDENSNDAYSKGYINQADKAKITVCKIKIENTGRKFV